MQVGRHAQYSALLTAVGANALPSLHDPQSSVFTTLDSIGKQEISEQLALGRLATEVALDYEIPVLHFRAWMRERMTDDEMAEIRSAAAESLQVKATLVLSAELKNPAEASQAKALSERFAKQAESLDPKAWSAGHITPERTLPVINISFSSSAGIDRVDTVVLEHEEVEVFHTSAESCARNHDSTSTAHKKAVEVAAPLIGIDMTAPVPAAPRRAGW